MVSYNSQMRRWARWDPLRRKKYPSRRVLHFMGTRSNKTIHYQFLRALAPNQHMSPGSSVGLKIERGMALERLVSKVPPT